MGFNSGISPKSQHSQNKPIGNLRAGTPNPREISVELLKGLFGGFPQGYERPAVMGGTHFLVSRKWREML